MATFQKRNKRWSVIFDLPPDSGEEQRKQKRLSGFATRREAELAYINYRGTYVAPRRDSDKSFADAVCRYLDYQQTRIKESSLVSIATVFDLHLLPTFGDLQLAQITTKDIVTWQAKMDSSGYGYKYKHKMLGFLKAFFNYCVHIEESIPSNPVKRQLKFLDTRIRSEMLIYTPEEYKAFRKVITKPVDIIIFDLLYFTGMRKGELLALKWGDLRGNILSISKTYSRKTSDGKWKLTSPKSKNSTRDILLPDFLVAEMLDYKTNSHADDNHFIIGYETPNNERYLDLARNRYTAIAGIKRIRIHDFRHSHVSYLIGENIDVMTIAKRVGDNVSTILSTYAHMMPNKQADMVSKLSTLMS